MGAAAAGEGRLESKGAELGVCRCVVVGGGCKGLYFIGTRSGLVS